MAPSNFPKSKRKYIRQEKARIRRGVLSLQEQATLISELYQARPENKKPEKRTENKKANKKPKTSKPKKVKV